MQSQPLKGIEAAEAEARRIYFEPICLCQANIDLRPEPRFQDDPCARVPRMLVLRHRVRTQSLYIYNPLRRCDELDT